MLSTPIDHLHAVPCTLSYLLLLGWRTSTDSTCPGQSESFALMIALVLLRQSLRNTHLRINAYVCKFRGTGESNRDYSPHPRVCWPFSLCLSVSLCQPRVDQTQ